jgi:amidase
VWRDGSAAAGASTAAVLDSAVTRLRELGAIVIDPVELPGADKIWEPEFAALLHEFKHSVGAYLAALPGNVPRTLAEVIGFNQRNAGLVLARFGQELFEQAEATRGGAGDPGYLELRADAARLASVAMETPLVTHRLDAIVALTASPAWLTDYALGDHDVFHTSAPAAVGGYPAVSLPFGYVWGLPVGLSFMGPRWSESRLIALAYAFEQAAAAGSSATALAATGVPPHVTTGSAPYLAETLSP